MRYLALLALALASACATEARSPEPTTPCQEDEACWDCSTMGNGRCGPVEP